MKHLLMILVAFYLCLPVAGQDKPKPLPKDIRSLKALAKKGDTKAQFNLGVMYDEGKGVLEDDKEAVKWFSKAAEKGYYKAQYSLGWMYAEGDGVLEDDKEAVKWFLKAAEKGYYKAQFNLGVMYAKGEGVLENDVSALAWFNIAAANGDTESQKTKRIIAKQMSPGQIARAQELSNILSARILSQKKVAKPGLGSTYPIDRRIKSLGTGFFITGDGYILTNYHVVDEANHVSIKTGKGVLLARIVKVDRQNDLAVLKAEGKFEALPIVSSRRVALGDEVFTIGFPRPTVQGYSPKLTKGVISSLAGFRDDPRNFQISVQNTAR